MSPYGSISTICRAEVQVPDDVFERFGHLKEYETFSYSVTSRLKGASGQDRYAEVIEWFEGPTYFQCEEFINRWHNQILQWQSQMRSEG